MKVRLIQTIIGITMIMFAVTISGEQLAVSFLGGLLSFNGVLEIFNIKARKG